MGKKDLYMVFGKKKNETSGNFYNFLGSSETDAKQQAKKKYNLKVLSVYKR